MNEIGKTLLNDTPYVTLGGSSVTCFLRSDTEAIHIAKGASATYRGRVTGYSLGSVTVSDCVYVARSR